jgi:hypothetical protein
MIIGHAGVADSYARAEMNILNPFQTGMAMA